MFLSGEQHRTGLPSGYPPLPRVTPGHEPITAAATKTPSPLQLHIFAQRFSQQLHHRDPPSPRAPSAADTPRSPTSTTYEANFHRQRARKPRHVPIVISPAIYENVLKNLPPSPTSPEFSPDTAQPWGHGQPSESEAAPSTAAAPPLRRRHIPIVIPEWARPHSLLPPTPSTSAESTPRASPNPHSCEELLAAMSRPSTNGSRTSTMESTQSATITHDLPPGRFTPAGSHRGEMNSGSESSLHQSYQDAQSSTTADPVPRSSHGPGPTPPPTEPSATLPHSHPPTNGTTNLSGLVCNVHKSTGREPLARVGATTTILGDKLYVFGGRILSRKQHMKVTSEMYELDLIRRHWTKIETTGATPKPRYFHTVCGLGDSKLICYGGMSPTPVPADRSTTASAGNPPAPTNDPMENMMVMSDIHIYDTRKRSWTHIATSDTPPGRYAHCAAVVPSSAVFTSASAPLSAMHHNPPSSMPNQGHLGVALDGSGGAEMIVVGGQDCHNKYIDAISVFNLRNLKWTDTHPLERSCGAYRSVVTPLTSMPPSHIGTTPRDQAHDVEGSNGVPDKTEPSSSMLIYSNYNFLDVKLELQARLPDGTLKEKHMTGPVSPPGLRFPSGDILDHHFIVSGTYLTSSKHEYALWALDLRTLTWSRIDAGGGIFSQGSWNRGILWARRNTFIILGNRKRVLVEDYNRRRINFSHLCMVELEAFGLYDNPRRAWPTSNFPSISAPVLPPSVTSKAFSTAGRPLSSAAVDLGIMAMKTRDLADMDLLAIGGERIPVNSHLLARRWGPYFIQLLRDSGRSLGTLQNDASSSSDGGTLRPGHLNPNSVTSRNSSITITPSITTTTSTAPSTLTVGSTSSLSQPGHALVDAPTPLSLPPSMRPRQLYLPHTVLTLRALVQYLYTAALPPPQHELSTPQILCSLLQLARPYRVDGLLEATVERLHQVLDGRNAAAVFNAAAMAAGGGRGTGTPFGKEGEPDPPDDLPAGLTITPFPRRDSQPAPATLGSGSQSSLRGGPSESGEDSESAASSNATSESASEADVGTVSATTTTAAGSRQKRLAAAVGGADEVWAGSMSCVVGLQKRGLRGLMEGRRMRERERGLAGAVAVDGGSGGGGAAAANGLVPNGVPVPVGLGIV